ncbi:delta 1-pyrroline-5-carboxylate dehydrogenase [Veronia nyctiphanis]|uniref:Delta 1-pyrroline-5-carboxylate dehydrogenase n=1 Tax=Veronia nyctiphanis TaxID=1278244 RepID=A0A4Q0YM30_9GAMM|nr:aldehyde dehydrogenase family protein [Veronia nyctiphanis]RXJ71892.1 delta 1-pyrroline-5-carboxylate dehydrogenase [Veronia nyctiphanis]
MNSQAQGVTAVAAIDQSLALWEDWNHQGVEQRIALLNAWADSVSHRGGQVFSDTAAMIRFQCQSATRYLSPVHEMPGPTGESNELYASGRGVFAVTGDSSLTVIALAGQLAATLLAGNCAVVVVPDAVAEQADALLADLVKAGCPARVASRIADTELAAITTDPRLAGVAVTAHQNVIREINQRLAGRSGLLAQLVAETDASQLMTIGSPSYILRFITERTRTINVTAVGGNATLLELGSG